jgi:hypothetical protein
VTYKIRIADDGDLDPDTFSYTIFFLQDGSQVELPNDLRLSQNVAAKYSMDSMLDRLQNDALKIEGTEDSVRIFAEDILCAQWIQDISSSSQNTVGEAERLKLEQQLASTCPLEKIERGTMILDTESDEVNFNIEEVYASSLNPDGAKSNVQTSYSITIATTDDSAEAVSRSLYFNAQTGQVSCAANDAALASPQKISMISEYQPGIDASASLGDNVSNFYGHWCFSIGTMPRLLEIKIFEESKAIMSHVVDMAWLEKSENADSVLSSAFEHNAESGEYLYPTSAVQNASAASPLYQDANGLYFKLPTPADVDLLPFTMIGSGSSKGTKVELAGTYTFNGVTYMKVYFDETGLVGADFYRLSDTSYGSCQSRLNPVQITNWCDLQFSFCKK